MALDMVTKVVATPATVRQVRQVQQQGYQLQKEDRQVLLSRSREGRRTLLIERQRDAFIAMYGSPFGEEPASPMH